ncbi:hypothetical protein SAMN06265222_107142 [Neorhodopirellula lusitana]|uniref:Uncharacterized protein n=1 Tax=Neorhodopirellula lusitana TaxID=445327 RepID=A0ABY1Q7C6_9BACT|nr:hypothetical protein SAMN06265222_107142 [Neorhodopirellula lusitana]
MASQVTVSSDAPRLLTATLGDLAVSTSLGCLVCPVCHVTIRRTDPPNQIDDMHNDQLSQIRSQLNFHGQASGRLGCPFRVTSESNVCNSRAKRPQI